VTFGILAALLAAGLAGPALSLLAPSRIPVVVGEIAAGLALGVTGFGFIDPTEPTTAFFGRVGFAMLMFVAGTHVPLRAPGLRPALARGVLAAATAGVVAVPAAVLLASLTGISHAAVLALPMATSSAAVVLPVLRERRVDAAHAAHVVAWVAVADVATIVALPLALATGTVVAAALGSAVVAAAALAILTGASLSRRTGAVRSIRRLSKRLEWALDLRLSLLALATLAWIADRVGTSILVAGFSAGLIVAAVGQPRRLGRQVRGVAEGFLVPLFFVLLGARLDLRALASHPADLVLALALVAAATVVHGLAGLVSRQSLAVGLTATAALGVPAAVVEVGLNRHLIDPGQGAAIILAALLSLAVSAAGAALLPVPAPRGDRPATP
jgi:Kef-type K+ transport system membrane component KefB